MAQKQAFVSVMQTSFAKIIVRSLLGAVCGAISGAALLGVPTYLSTETGFLGPESAWATLAAIVGGVWGSIAGALIGFLVAKFQMNKLSSGIVGAAVGASLVVLLLLSGGDPHSDWKMFSTTLAAIPIAAVIGVIVSATNKGQVKTALQS